MNNMFSLQILASVLNYVWDCAETEGFGVIGDNFLGALLFLSLVAVGGGNKTLEIVIVPSRLNHML